MEQHTNLELEIDGTEENNRETKIRIGSEKMRKESSIKTRKVISCFKFIVCLVLFFNFAFCAWGIAGVYTSDHPVHTTTFFVTILCISASFPLFTGSILAVFKWLILNREERKSSELQICIFVPELVLVLFEIGRLCELILFPRDPYILIFVICGMTISDLLFHFVSAVIYSLALIYSKGYIVQEKYYEMLKKYPCWLMSLIVNFVGVCLGVLLKVYLDGKFGGELDDQKIATDVERILDV